MKSGVLTTIILFVLIIIVVTLVNVSQSGSTEEFNLGHTSLDGEYCDASGCHEPEFTHGTAGTSHAIFKGFVCLRDDANGDELIIGNLPNDDSLNINNLAGTYNVTMNNVTKYSIGGNVYTEDKTDLSIGGSQKIIILEPNPYEYAFSDSDTKFPIYLELKNVSTTIHIVNATKLNWTNTTHVMNCYDRPLRLQGYSGVAYDDHVIIMNPNNTSYTDIAYTSKSDFFHENDYRNTVTGWNPKSFTQLRLMSALTSNELAEESPYDSSTDPRIELNQDNLGTTTIDFSYKTNKEKKTLNFKQITHSLDSPNTSGTDIDQNKYIQMVFKSGHKDLIVTSSDLIANNCMTIKFESSGNYNNTERNYYPTVGYGTSAVYYCPLIRFRKGQNNFLYMVKLSNMGDYAKLTIVGNSDDTLYLFHAENVDWTNKYVNATHKGGDQITLYQDASDTTGITLDGSNMTDLNSHFPFPSTGMSLNFTHFKNGTELNYQFNSSDFSTSNIVRIAHKVNSNILDIELTGSSIQHGIMKTMNLKTTYSNIVIPRGVKATLCTSNYDIIKSSTTGNPFAYSNNCTKKHNTTSNITLPISTYNSVYVHPEERYRKGYKDYVKLCETSNKCINIKRADQLNWAGVNNSNILLSNPFGDHSNVDTHVMSTVDYALLNGYYFTLNTLLKRVFVNANNLTLSNNQNTEFAFHSVNSSSGTVIRYAEIKEKNTNKFLYVGLDRKLYTSHVNLTETTFTIFRNNTNYATVFIGFRSKNYTGYLQIVNETEIRAVTIYELYPSMNDHSFKFYIEFYYLSVILNSNNYFQIMKYTQHEDGSNNACLALDQDSIASGRHVRLEECDSTKQKQHWRIDMNASKTRSSTGSQPYRRIRHAWNTSGSTPMCLDYDGGTKVGYGAVVDSGSAAFQVYSCDNNDNKFFLIGNGNDDPYTSKIRAYSDNGSKCLNIQDGVYGSTDPSFGSVDCGSNPTVFTLQRV